MTYTRQSPSARYQELIAQYRQLHEKGDAQRGIPAAQMFDGRSLPRQASRIKRLIQRTGAKRILDYGCGKGTQYLPGKILEGGIPRWGSVQEYWGVDEIRCYDPAYAPHSALPTGVYDGVVCTDVLEHCPEEDMAWIVAELFDRAARFVYANVACYPAGKTLPNGENAHCTILPVEKWRDLFAAACASRPEVLWECWADREYGNPLSEMRIANFPEAPPARPAAGRIPAWRLV